ncbi:poly(A)-specific ribonuclease PARN isoform X2 [Nasonia vitripennis]|uniref:Poly(A)-specific ribonuclease RNA-binding domain-containing protein n=1 Tax=Nasonia vitripennis TaxID=7425 RepID=A0A7M7QIZ4_NASVI|nr:poly(A)-specific ribonuclease PARN isoform X2 [Nasonia vitripennis]
MEVTRSNFQDVLKELDEVLDKATFLAIDGEFTGLNSGPDANAFDTPAQYYTKLRKGSMNFLLVQFGLAVFTYNSKTNLYSQRSYNFYVFPRPLDRTSPDCRFMCQASSIVFLANEGFDFNKLFKEGIPYLTKEDEEKLNKKMVDKQKVREEGLDLIPISDDDKPQIDEICSGIEDYVNSEDDGKELRIERCNAFIRRLVHQEARLRWPNKIRLETRNENGNQFIIVSKIGTKEEEEQKETERKERVKLEVQEAVGLSVLLRKIADSGKVIVGHNMLLDLCHIIHQFFAPLPESYHEFKSLVHCLFPRLLDTKIICQSGQFKDSVPSNLNQLLETLHSAPFSIPETENIPDRSYKLNNDKSHEAGYDAYITGLCFIALCNRLGELQIPEISTVLPDSPLLNPYLNKLLIARLKDYPHINLIGNDPNPSREHVFHVTFPKQWKLSDLTSLFSPYGGAYVAWLSDTTAYAALHRRDQVSAVVQNLFKSTHYSLKKYRDYQASVEVEETVTKVTTPKTKTTTTTTTKPERKRKISERESPGDEGSAEKAEATGQEDTATADSPKDEEDGWAVASGNDPSSSSTFPAAIRADDKPSPDEEARRDDERRRRRQYEEFCLVRKGGAGKLVTARMELTSSTRYTVLSDLEDDEVARFSVEEELVEFEELEGGLLKVRRERVVESKRQGSPKKSRTTPVKSITDSPRATKRGSPKKSPASSSPDKRKQTATTSSPTLRRRHAAEESPKLDDSRKVNKQKQSAPRSGFSWMKVVQIVALLSTLYIIIHL